MAVYNVVVALSKGSPVYHLPFDEPVYASIDGYIVILDDQKRLSGRTIIAAFGL